jgi:hypothetical protein
MIQARDFTAQVIANQRLSGSAPVRKGDGPPKTAR